MKLVNLPGAFVRHGLELQGRCQHRGVAGKALKTKEKALGGACARGAISGSASKNSGVRIVSATTEIQSPPDPDPAKAALAL